METYVPGEVYNNLIKMMKYRGVKLSSDPLESDTVVQKLNHYEFVTIAGTRDKNDIRGEATVMVILIAPNSKYSNKSGDFKKLLKGLPKTKPGENLEVIFVSENELTIHIRKTIAAFKQENSKIHIEDHDYEIFMLENPKHESVPEHIIPSEEEILEFCNTHYKDRNSFPKILQSDAQAVWLGLRPGMCVKVKRISETAGYSYIYRICIKG
jgi:DNA-directed RNA polymerase subunit H (RpoH/RPB5)